MYAVATIQNPKPFKSKIPNLSLLDLCTNIRELQQIHAHFIKTGLVKNPIATGRIVEFCVIGGHGNESDSLHYALSVFNAIKRPDTFTWNTLIRAHLNHGRHENALHMFYQMLVLDVSCDKFTYTFIAKACSQMNSIEEGEQIHCQIIKNGCILDSFIQNTLIHMYARCGDAVAARRVFDQMGMKNVVSWNAMIDGYIKIGEIESACRIFEEMPERDVASWNSMIDGYAKSGEIELGRAFFDRMEERDVVSWNSMIDGYTKCGRVDEAKDLFDSMGHRDLVSWNSLITGLAQNGRSKEALDVFDAMLMERNVRADETTMVGVLSAVSDLGMLEKGRWLSNFICKNKFELGGPLGTALIDMYSNCGSIYSAIHVFKSIKHKMVEHWTATIMGLAVHGLGHKALDLFVEMQRLEMRPNDITFVGVLTACSHAGLIKDGLIYFELMKKKYKMTPKVQHFGCLVDLLSRAGHLDAAKDVIDKMPIDPNEVIWLTLLSGGRSHGNVAVAEFAARQLVEMGSTADGLFVLLSNTYASAGKWEEVAKVREMMKRDGVRKVPGRSWVESNGVVHEFHAEDDRHPMRFEIYAKIDEMMKRLKTEGYRPDMKQVLLDVKEEEKERALWRHSERLATAFGLLSLEQGTPIRIMKNLRICVDCHSAMKVISKIYGREIVMRDKNRFHNFKDGLCSCGDYW